MRENKKNQIHPSEFIYIIVSATMKMITSIIILFIIYTNNENAGDIKWYIVGLTIIWAFYPLYRFYSQIPQKLEGEKK